MDRYEEAIALPAGESREAVTKVINSFITRDEETGKLIPVPGHPYFLEKITWKREKSLDEQLNGTSLHQLATIKMRCLHPGI